MFVTAKKDRIQNGKIVRVASYSNVELVTTYKCNTVYIPFCHYLFEKK